MSNEIRVFPHISHTMRVLLSLWSWLVLIWISMLGACALIALPGILGEGSAIAVIVGAAFLLLLFMFGFGLISFAAARLQRGQPAEGAAKAGVKGLPIVLVALLVTGSIQSFIPIIGIWLAANFYCMVPAALLERRGFSAVERSFELVKRSRLRLLFVGLALQVMVLIWIMTTGAILAALNVSNHVLAGVTAVPASLVAVFWLMLPAASTGVAYAELSTAQQEASQETP